MELTILLFLLGGLFLGWSLGANDAANVFGTAVGTRMVSFKTAAIVCSIFVILGSVISGAGTTETIGKLGAINALPGAFACCVAGGLCSRAVAELLSFKCLTNVISLVRPLEKVCSCQWKYGSWTQTCNSSPPCGGVIGTHSYLRLTVWIFGLITT